jgi:hypothetical protein
MFHFVRAISQFSVNTDFSPQTYYIIFAKLTKIAMNRWMNLKETVFLLKNTIIFIELCLIYEKFGE